MSHACCTSTGLQVVAGRVRAAPHLTNSFAAKACHAVTKVPPKLFMLVLHAMCKTIRKHHSYDGGRNAVCGGLEP